MGDKVFVEMGDQVSQKWEIKFSQKWEIKFSQKWEIKFSRNGRSSFRRNGRSSFAEMEDQVSQKWEIKLGRNEDAIIAFSLKSQDFPTVPSHLLHCLASPCLLFLSTVNNTIVPCWTGSAVQGRLSTPASPQVHPPSPSSLKSTKYYSSIIFLLL